jgi:hypothetical protein
MANQFKKLVYNKKMVDYGDAGAIAEWKLSPWKVFFVLMAVATILTVVYAYFFTSNPKEFLGTIIFYVIVILAVIAILYLTASTAGKFRNLLTGFMIAFILILVLYWFLGVLLGYFEIIEFHTGYSLWILISALAYMGAKRIDGNLDRHDIGFGLLAFIVLMGANIPINETGGFLANLDNLINMIFGFL